MIEVILHLLVGLGNTCQTTERLTSHSHETREVGHEPRDELRLELRQSLPRRPGVGPGHHGEGGQLSDELLRF